MTEERTRRGASGSTPRTRSPERPASRETDACTRSSTAGSSSRPSARTHSEHRSRGGVRLPGVVAVLTADDLPISGSGSDRTTEPLVRSEVVFAGQPVALVVAETETAAADAVELVGVEYEPLPAVVDVEDAMLPGARSRVVEDDEGGSDLESIHASVSKGQESQDEEQLSGTSSTRSAAARATPPRCSSRATRSSRDVPDAVGLPGVHRASGLHRVARAERRARRLDEHAGAFVTQRELARAFGLPLERIRVIAEPLGGAFGGKFALMEPLAAGAALALGRPVRVVLTRAEDFHATNPASAQVTHLRIGARADGTLTAISGRMIVDRGTNAGWGVEGASSSSSPGRTGGRLTISAATACRPTDSRSARTAPQGRRRRPSLSRRSSTSWPKRSASTPSSYAPKRRGGRRCRHQRECLPTDGCGGGPRAHP